MVKCLACGGEHATTMETYLCRPLKPQAPEPAALMLHLKALRDESLLGIGPLWQTVIPGYSDGYRLLHADPFVALEWMTGKVQDIRARGWFEYAGEESSYHLKPWPGFIRI